MGIIQSAPREESQALKYYGLISITMLFLVGCGMTNTPLQPTQPKQSIAISSSPAVSLSPCTPVTNGNFLSAHTLREDKTLFTLIGVLPLSHNTLGIPKDYLEELSKQIVCYKTDPTLTKENYIYVYDKEERLINGVIIQKGFAQTDKKNSYIYRGFFEKLEKEAQENKRGLWDSTATTEVKTHISAPSRTLTPTEVPSYLDLPVQITFTIESVGITDKGVYLNSLNDFARPENIAILLSHEGDDRMRTLAKNAERYIKHPISVSGTVRLIQGKMILSLEKGSDLKILK